MTQTQNDLTRALSLVKNLFPVQAIDLHDVDMEHRALDEFGRRGRRFADDYIKFCENGNLRIIIRQCSEDGNFWFEVEIGYVYPDADSAALHPIKITYGDDGLDPEPRYTWSIGRLDSPESLALLTAINPDVAARCPISGEPDPEDRLSTVDKTSPDSAFFVGLIDDFITHLRVNGVPPGTTTLDVPTPPVC